MTIPRNDVLAAEPRTKKTVESDRFHKLSFKKDGGIFE